MDNKKSNIYAYNVHTDWEDAYSLRVLAALSGGLSLGLSTPKKFSSSEVVTPDSGYLVPSFGFPRHLYTLHVHKDTFKRTNEIKIF